MVYGIVQRHHGVLEVESEPGSGTTFTIRLPIPPIPLEPGVQPDAPPLAEHLHMLVVDDEPSLREILAIFLAEDGHTVETAADGVEGLAAFRAHPFDLVITDKAMPGMNGEQFSAAIHNLVPNQPVIMLTGFGDLMNAAGELPIGVTVILGKPFVHAELRAALMQAMTGMGQAAIAAKHTERPEPDSPEIGVRTISTL